MSQQEIDEVYRQHKNFVDAMVQTGMSGIVEHLDSEVKFHPPGEPSVVGLEAVERWCRNADQEFAFESITCSNEEYTDAGNYIIETGQFGWKIVPRSGGEPVVNNGTYLAIWRRQADGGWKVVTDIWNRNG